jgi:uncharacterized protein YidB (DUF937 family)
MNKVPRFAGALFARLSRELPEAVDKYTPQGRVPAVAYSERLT